MAIDNYQLLAIDKFHPVYQQAALLIRQVYHRKYKAELYHIFEHLLVVSYREMPVAALGFNVASTQPFFLDCYFEEPVHWQLSAKGLEVDAHKIVEIGHMVSSIPKGSWALIRFTAEYLTQRQYQWIVFTATHSLRTIFNKLT